MASQAAENDRSVWPYEFCTEQSMAKLRRSLAVAANELEMSQLSNHVLAIDAETRNGSMYTRNVIAQARLSAIELEVRKEWQDGAASSDAVLFSLRRIRDHRVAVEDLIEYQHFTQLRKGVFKDLADIEDCQDLQALARSYLNGLEDDLMPPMLPLFWTGGFRVFIS